MEKKPKQNWLNEITDLPNILVFSKMKGCLLYLIYPLIIITILILLYLIFI